MNVRPSPTHGLGLFAETALAQGDVVSRLGGTLVDTLDMQHQIALALRGERGYVDTITVGDDLHLLLPEGTPNGRGNHSCDPNTWWSGHYTLAARRPILAGEELTNDYATSTDADDFIMTCRCRTALCRMTVKGRDWQRRDLQNRYGRHWTPSILNRIHLAAPHG